ncbi:MAG: phage integrase N-terminal SAM-like domain-containing protein [Acidobacteriota bacterium]|nr:phage integrase N-terminal SAM-like domain-containing protein [Acidobacteriota bacterium]
MPDDPISPAPPKLLEGVRAAIRLRHYSRRTEQAYVSWIRRFIVYHGKRHPRELGAPEVTGFLSSLAERSVSASTQNQALSAILFLYDVVLGERLPWMNDIVRAQRPVRLPVVLSRNEVASLLLQLRGPAWLMASLMYGAGLRLLECAELRVKDINFDRGELTIRDATGGKDRVTMLPAAVKAPLEDHFARMKRQHESDLATGRGSVSLPGALSEHSSTKHATSRNGVVSRRRTFERRRPTPTWSRRARPSVTSCRGGARLIWTVRWTSSHSGLVARIQTGRSGCHALAATSSLRFSSDDGRLLE